MLSDSTLYMASRDHSRRCDFRGELRWFRAFWLLCVLLGAFLISCGSSSDPVAELEEGEELPGGSTTNTLLLGSNAFTLPLANLSDDRRGDFFTGDSFFNQNWVIAPASTTARDGLGPTFNARSCAGCHFKDGRGRPPESPDETPVGLLFRVSVLDETGAPTDHPAYGGQLQPFAIAGIPPEVRIRVSFEEVPGMYADGERYTLSRPVVEFVDPAFGELPSNLMVSPRVAPAVIGLGLLESIAEEDILDLEDPEDENGDGVSGRVNRVWDSDVEEARIGRFGWKANQTSLRQQNAGAFLGDLGVTSPVFPTNDCPLPQIECASAPHGGTPEIEESSFRKVVVYTQSLAVPVRRNASDPLVLRGKQLFAQARCSSCHVPSHVTSERAVLPELARQRIWPYTDLLLHDMGDELADGRPDFEASGNEWRTPPLWSLGLIDEVNRHQRLLHDGRANGFAEAILWHGGEGEEAKQAFVNMEKSDREALVAFLASL